MNHVLDKQRRQYLGLEPGEAGAIRRFGNVAGGQELFEPFEGQFYLPAGTIQFQDQSRWPTVRQGSKHQDEGG
jgi:hypothetical protein